MKNYTITVNGNVYDVTVEEKGAGAQHGPSAQGDHGLISVPASGIVFLCGICHHSYGNGCYYQLYQRQLCGSQRNVRGFGELHPSF